MNLSARRLSISLQVTPELPLLSQVGGISSVIAGMTPALAELGWSPVLLSPYFPRMPGFAKVELADKPVLSFMASCFSDGDVREEPVTIFEARVDEELFRSARLFLICSSTFSRRTHPYTQDGVLAGDYIEANGQVTATCRGVFVAVKEGHPAYHRW